MFKTFRVERKKVDLGKYSIVILEFAGKKYEIIVDPRAALEYYKGNKSADEVIILYEVYHDYQKGIRATSDEIKKIVLRAAIEKLKMKKGAPLSDEEIQKIREQVEELDEEKLKELASKYILEKGQLKLPKELRDELLDKLVKRIISYVQKYAINPATKAPYPPTKIEEALMQVISGVKSGEQRVRVVLDPLKSFEEQLPEVIRALKTILPIKLEIITVRVKIPTQYTGIAYARLEAYGHVKESKWLDDGSLEAIVEVPGGQFIQFHNTLANVTKGTARISVIERKSIE